MRDGSGKRNVHGGQAEKLEALTQRTQRKEEGTEKRERKITG
jgi:hypothetical protein